jgi:hypothetical protein
MYNEANVKEKIENVNNEFEYELRMKKIREEVLKSFEGYNQTLKYMAADVPLSILCLPQRIEKALIGHGCLRVYDLFNCDFVEIKGLDEIAIRDLTSRLDKFFAMF